MNVQLSDFFCLLLITAICGCNSVHTFDDPGLDKLKSGEYATVYENSGRVARIYITAIDEMTIKGYYQRGGPVVEISWNDIELVEVTRPDAVKSVVAGVGTAAGASLGGALLLYLMFL